LKESGTPMKRKGLFVVSKEMLIKFGEALNDDHTFQLIQEIERVNPKGMENKVKKLEMWKFDLSIGLG